MNTEFYNTLLTERDIERTAGMTVGRVATPRKSMKGVKKELALMDAAQAVSKGALTTYQAGELLKR